jgi:large subunit ribosomal protein L24e
MVEKGTGKMFIHSTGKILYFCSTKCEKNLLKLHRDPRNFKWASKEKK